MMDRVFNVGTREGAAVHTFVELLRKAYKAPVELGLSGNFRPADFRHLIADNSRIRGPGWAPTVPVPEGITRCAQWILFKPRPAENFSKAASWVPSLTKHERSGHAKLVRRFGACDSSDDRAS